MWKQKQHLLSFWGRLQWRIFLLGVLVSGILWAARSSTALMGLLSEFVVRPIHRSLALQCEKVSFSVAEAVIGGTVAGLLLFLVTELVFLIRKPNRFRRFLSMVLTPCAAISIIYAGFSLLWGVYYYSEDFMTMSGLKNDPVSVEQLEKTTAYFANRLNESAKLVERDENGAYTADREAILAKSANIFSVTEQKIPCLAGDPIHAKGIACSKLMSYLDFTGFFFPFTGEANVNMDFPSGLFASTVAHELSHQRGIAKEQEANFAAVIVCMDSGDPDYLYSGSMLAYIHLGNALYSADPARWETIRATLTEQVQKDLEINREYWSRYDTPLGDISDTVYEGFLQSYDQKLGLQSYGACVDMLVNYNFEQ